MDTLLWLHDGHSATSLERHYCDRTAIQGHYVTRQSIPDGTAGVHIYEHSYTAQSVCAGCRRQGSRMYLGWSISWWSFRHGRADAVHTHRMKWLPGGLPWNRHLGWSNLKVPVYRLLTGAFIIASRTTLLQRISYNSSILYIAQSKQYMHRYAGEMLHN